MTLERESAPILVSICIATMNRAKPLARTLQTLAADVDEQVEIVVLDSSPDDQTKTAVEEFARRHPSLPISYHHQPPGGIDHDYAAAIAKGVGKYRWPFTDDDWLLPGTFAQVRRALDEAPAGVVVNFEFRDPQMKQRLRVRSNSPAEDTWFEPQQIDGLVQQGLSAYIGSLVVRQDWWMDRDPGRFEGSDVAHVWRLFQTPPPGRVLVLTNPGIAVRVGVSSWSAQAFRIWMIDWPDLVWSLPGVSESSKELITPRYPWHHDIRLIRLRAVGSLSRNDYEKWIKPARAPFKARWLARFLIHIPPRLVANCFYFALRFLKPSQTVYIAEMDGARKHL
jgi:glycosyltransferase involved in cell wall biosynthesis